MKKSRKRTSRRRMSRKRVSRKRVSRKRVSRKRSRKIRLRMNSDSDNDYADHIRQKRRDARECKRIMTAVMNNNLVKTIELLDKGTNPNVQMYEYSLNTPLHEAVAIGSIPIASLLLDRGADPNRMNTSRQTPLMIGAHMGIYPDIIRLLLNNRRVDPYLRGGEPVGYNNLLTAFQMADVEASQDQLRLNLRRTAGLRPYDPNALQLLRQRLDRDRWELSHELYKMLKLAESKRAFLKLPYPPTGSRTHNPSSHSRRTVTSDRLGPILTELVNMPLEIQRKIAREVRK